MRTDPYQSSAATTHPEAPGQLSSHYAPQTPLILLEDADAFSPPAGKRCRLLRWKSQPSAGYAEGRFLSQTQDLTEAAVNLFRCMRELDQQSLDLIVAEKLPEKGLGAAINDRLRRAVGSGNS